MGLKNRLLGSPKRIAITTSTAILLAAAILGGGHHAGEAISQNTSKSSIVNIQKASGYLANVLTNKSKHTITNIMSTQVITTENEDGVEVATDTVVITAKARNNKGKEYYVNFTITGTAEEAQIIYEEEADVMERLENYNPDSDSKRQLRKLVTSIEEYISSIAHFAETYTNDTTLAEQVKLGETIEITTTENNTEVASTDTGRSVLEIAYKFLSNQGLAHKERLDELAEQSKSILSDDSIKLQSTLAINLEEKTALIGTKIGNSIHYIEVDITDVAISSNNAEAKQQAVDYVKELLKSAKNHSLTDAQVATISEYSLADITSNTIFAIVSSLEASYENVHDDSIDSIF